MKQGCLLVTAFLPMTPMRLKSFRRRHTSCSLVGIAPKMREVRASEFGWSAAVVPDWTDMLERKREYDRALLAITVALTGIGLVMVYSSSMMWVESNGLSRSFLLTRQLMRLFAGLALMLVVMHVDYHVLARRSGSLFVAALVLLLALLIVNRPVNGVTRSLALRLPLLGEYVSSFQPAEIAKLALVVYLSDVLVKRQRVICSFSRGLLPHVLVIGLTVGLIMLQPDVGTGIAVGVSAAILLFVGNARLSHLLITGAACLPVVVWYALSADYRSIRITGFLHPDQYRDGVNYQITQALIAFSKGGAVGVGLGESKQKLLFLPEPFTDFIFPIIGEEFGLLGTIVVLALLLVFVRQGIRIARRAPDLFGFFLGVGITSMVGVHAVLNLAVTMGLLPTTGLALPFISYGGSGLLIALLSTGILLNISRQGRAEGLWTQDYGRRGDRIKGVRA